MGLISLFVPLTKVDDDQQMVWGYASTEKMDCQGEIVEKAGMVAALGDYMKWANIREMHKPSAVGTTKEAEMDEKGLFICAKIVDPIAWKKVKEGVYKGFSIGGSARQKIGNVIKQLSLNEISLVDRPANPECTIQVWKSADPVVDEEELEEEELEKAGNNEPGHPFRGNQYTDPDGKGGKDKFNLNKRVTTATTKANKMLARHKELMDAGDWKGAYTHGGEMWGHGAYMDGLFGTAMNRGIDVDSKVKETRRALSTAFGEAEKFYKTEWEKWYVKQPYTGSIMDQVRGKRPDGTFNKAADSDLIQVPVEVYEYLQQTKDEDGDIHKQEATEESTQQEEDDMTPQQEEKLEKIAKSAESIDKLVSASENLMKANQDLAKSNQDLAEQIKKQDEQIKKQEERLAKMEASPVDSKVTLKVIEKGGQGPIAKQENGVMTVEFDPSNPASVEKASTVIFKSILADGGTPVVKMRSEEIPLALRK